MSIFPILVPFIFLLIIPFMPIIMGISSTLGAHWPTKLACFLTRWTPVLLVSSNGEVTPGFLRRNEIGNVIAYEGIIPIFGDAASEDGTVHGISKSKWIPMP